MVGARLHDSRLSAGWPGLPGTTRPRFNEAMLFVLVPALALFSGDWPQFRGPYGNGVGPAAAIPHTWSESENVAWRIDVPGHGWSQPVVVGDVLYVTTAIGAGSPAPLTYQKGVDAPDTSKDPVSAAEIEWLVCAYDVKS